jgi:CcmD family protein
MLKRIGRLLVVACALALAPLSVAIAQETATTAAANAEPAEPAKKPPPGFERVAGAPDAEKIDASRLVVAAYIVFFVGMFGFVVYVSRKQTELAKEMEALASRINKAGK